MKTTRILRLGEFVLCGAALVALMIFVISASARDTSAGAPDGRGSSCSQGPINPPTSATYHLEDNAADWGAYCEGAPAWGKESAASPSLDDQSLCGGLTGGAAYSNVHFYRHLLSEPAANRFTLSLSFYFTPTTTFNNQGSPSVIQALEFTMNKWYRSQRYEFAVQWQNVGSGAPQWRYWDPNRADPWVDLGIGDVLEGEQWHSLVLEGEISAGQVHYLAVTIDGQRYGLDATVAPAAAPGEPDRLAVAFQLGGNYAETPYDVYVDEVSFIRESGAAVTPEDKIKIEADYIPACQYTVPGEAYGALNNIYGAPTWVVPSENTMAILGLDLAAQLLADPLYRDRAEAAADYLVRVQQPDGAWCDQYDHATCIDPAKSPRHTAEVMMALHRLGYPHDNESRYLAMQRGAEYLMACQDAAYKGGVDDGLLGGGKNEDGQWNRWRWTHDNGYAYWALKATQDWAASKGDLAFVNRTAVSAGRILEGIDQHLADPASPVWYIAVDENDVPLKNPHLPCLPTTAPAYPSWIQYSPQMLDVPVSGVNLPAVGEWIYQTFTPADGSGPGSLGYTCAPWPDGQLQAEEIPRFCPSGGS